MAANPSDVPAGESAFDAEEMRLLRGLAGAIIGPCPEHGLPGADDDTIFRRIVGRAAKHEAYFRAALRELAAAPSGPDDDARLRSFMAARRDFANLMLIIVAQCYYQDARVLHSHGMEARPPFPEGHAVEAGDWSLLEPVKRMHRIYRDVPPRSNA